MTPYATVLFLHFVGLIGLFIGYGLEWVASSALRRAITGDQARTWLGVYRLSLPISGPAVLLLILTGGYLASVINAMKQGWLFASILAIVIALLMGFMLLMPRMKDIRASLPEGSAPLSAEVLARVRQPFIVTLVRIRTTLAVGIVYLMTNKPETSGALITLCVAILIGVLFAAPTFAKRQSA
jgi:hypothetical protein